MFSAATIYYILGSVMLIGGLFVKWLAARDKDQEERFNARVLVVATAHNKLEGDLNAHIITAKTAERVLFSKLDTTTRELQDYKLYVAETYVNQAALEKMLHPIERRLEAIENDLRGDHRTSHRS